MDAPAYVLFAAIPFWNIFVLFTGSKVYIQPRPLLLEQIDLKRLVDAWMLQRFKSIIADQMPIKRDNIVLCQLAPEQVSIA